MGKESGNKRKTVTEIKSIVLFPENQNYTILTENAEDFWLSPDGKNMVIRENQAAGGTDIWTLKLYNLSNGVKSQLISEKDIYQKGADLLNVQFTQNPLEINLDIGMKEQMKNFTLDIGKNPPVLTEKATTSIPADIIVSQRINSNIYYLDNSGYVYKSDLTYMQKEKINSTPFSLKQETEYKLVIFPGQIFIQENQVLYQLNSQSGIFEEFFEPIKGLKLSPDSRKIVYFSDYEIWILFLQDSNEPPLGKTGDKLFLNRFSEKIGDIFWINSNYIAFNTGNSIKISEIDNRDKINIYDFGEFNAPELSFNTADNRLYALSEGDILSSAKLLP